uniref:FkbM family methyltransferase n=1 Tax=Gluconobacter kanchanaburiensis TaxID=563199 RepID=UPI002231EADB|nr:FkbM family methyltransferase [Gluconobacter kanchanaburiensis]
MGRFLDYCGEWAFNEVKFCASLLKEGARVLDIGAFIGTFGLGVASLRRLTSLCAVEGNPELIPFLNANISLAAQCPTTSVINAIVAPSGYEVHGHYGQEENLGSTSFVYDEATANVPDDVPVKATLPLTELRKQNGPFDLIKIDAEGMEYAILKDDREFVATGDSLIWIEYNEEISSLDCADLLLGLTLHYFSFPAHSFENYRSQIEPLLPWAYEDFLSPAATTDNAPSDQSPKSAPGEEAPEAERLDKLQEADTHSHELESALNDPRVLLQEAQKLAFERLEALNQLTK